MKNKVYRRLQKIKEIDTSSRSESKEIENKLNLELKRLVAYADAVKSRDFGFVSTFKGTYADLWRDWQRTRLTREETSKIVAKIQEEYGCAIDIAPTIDRILELIPQCDTPRKNKKTLEAVATIADRALNGCIEKGYNVPAMEILNRLSGVNDENALTLTPKSEEEIESYIKKIAANYAKKAIYKDNASYLTKALDAYRKQETRFFYLKCALIDEKFGEKFSGTRFVDEMKKYVEHIEESAWDSPKAGLLNNIENAREL